MMNSILVILRSFKKIILRSTYFLLIFFVNSSHIYIVLDYVNMLKTPLHAILLLDIIMMYTCLHARTQFILIHTFHSILSCYLRISFILNSILICDT